MAKEDLKKNHKDSQTEKEQLEQKSKKEDSSGREQDNDRTGIIPDDIDFKKFMGCGG